MDHADDDGSDLDLVPMVQRLVRIIDARSLVDRDRDVMLEREPAVACEMVGVRVRLERAHDSHPEACCLGDNRLDRIRRIDDRCDPRSFVADEVAGAA